MYGSNAVSVKGVESVMRKCNVFLMSVLALCLVFLAFPMNAAADGLSFPEESSVSVVQGTVETDLGTIDYPSVSGSGYKMITIETPYTDFRNLVGASVPTTLKLIYGGSEHEMRQSGTTVSGNGAPILYGTVTVSGRPRTINQFPVNAVLGVSEAAWDAAEPGIYSATVTYKVTLTDSNNNETVRYFTQNLSLWVEKVPIDEAHFPDPVFRAYVADVGVDRDRNGILARNEIEATKTIVINRDSMVSMKGIEYFTELETLDVTRNMLKELDLNSNQKLKYLYCDYNQLTSLDIRFCEDLVTIECSINDLTTLDLERLNKLKNLNCSSNNLKYLNVDSDVLETLMCGSNPQMYALYLGNAAPALRYLECHYNPNLKFVDISRSARILYAWNNARTLNGNYYVCRLQDYASFYVDITTDVITTSLTGWQKIGRYWYYFSNLSGTLIDQFAWLDKLYYFDEYGIMQNSGWKKVGGYWYYFNTSGAAAIGWKQIDGEWYFFERYFGSLVQNDFVTDNGKTYYMTGSGAMATGWRKINDKWYYFDPGSGAMAKYAWKEIEGEWYWFNSEGQMVTGLQTINGKVYYFTSGGQMVTGWKTVDGKRYYFTGSGAAAKGWAKIDGKTYYFKADCVMAASEYWDGWWLNADGTWTYPYQAHWEEDMHGWYYMDTSGWYAKNATYLIDGVSYTFNAQGYRVP